MAANKPVILDLSLREYFTGLMGEVNKESNLNISDMSFIYLSEILESNLFLAKSNDSLDKEFSAFSEMMLSEHYLKAMQSLEGEAGSYKLRSVGERALYQAGFFSGALKRKLVGLDLYFQIGSSAYSGLFQKTQSPVFQDIGLKFSNYVDLFMGVSQKVHLQSSTDILSLFDHLNERNSKKAQDDLIKLGVIPVKSKKASNQ